MSKTDGQVQAERGNPHLDARELLRHRTEDLSGRHGARPSVRFDGRDWTWREVLEIGASADAALADRGVPLRAPVAILAREQPATLGLFLQFLAQGRPIVLIGARQPEAIVRSNAASIGFRVAVGVSADVLPLAVDDQPEGGMVAIGVGAEGEIEAAGNTAVDAGQALEVDDSTAVTIMTSGTTGPPKPVDLPWSFVHRIVGASEPGSPADARGAIINTLPLSSIGGVLTMVNSAWSGRRLALMDPFSLEEWVTYLREFRPRRSGGPPALLRMVLDAEIDPDVFGSVTCFETGSAPVDPETAAEFERVYGVPVLPAYGATEFMAAVAAWTLDDHAHWADRKRGSVGRARSGVALRVVDEDRAVLAAGEEGRLEVRMAEGSWTSTNDRATVDEDGFLYIHGRLDDVIMRGGLKVDCAAVERALEEHPAIAEAAVIGRDDDRLGAVPIAVIVTEDAAFDRVAELRTWLRDKVPAYAVPVDITIAASIPRNDMMKPDRPAIRALVGRNA